MPSKKFAAKNSELLIKRKSSPPNQNENTELINEIAWYNEQLDRIQWQDDQPDSNKIASMAATIAAPYPQMKVESAVERAFKIFTYTQLFVRDKTKPSDNENTRQVLAKCSSFWRKGVWPLRNDGSPYKYRSLNQFLRFFIPHKNDSERRLIYLEFLVDNPGGCHRSNKVAKELLKKHSGKKFTFSDYEDLSRTIVEWWMNHPKYNPLKFPEDSLGQIAFNNLVGEGKLD
ncbi:hypothetical protein N8513_00305 [bacterium]|nr:hypothetical protein [bacterium]MDB4369453.1 hypothetical protein [Akkermansiaceae bacterium]MDB4433964.1 hypothetical protein [Akkermansiaceae bacterium]